MKGILCKITALLILAPAITLAEPLATQPPSNQTISTSTEHFRLALQYLGPLFIKEGQLSADRNNLLTKDVLDNLKKLQSNLPPFSNDEASQTIDPTFSESNSTLTTKVYKGLESIPNQAGIFHPRSVAEVQTLINFAKLHHFQVRAIGSAHSPQPAIYNAKNTHEIRIILDGDLRKIDSIEPDASKEFATVTAGAGCNLGVNPADKTSTLQNSFDYQVDQAGYALPTLGGISHQTIAGFLQTSSSGGSAKHNIADVIEAIEWVDGNGVIHYAKKGSDEFNAAVVSMGLFGIITHVTFQLPKKYLVEGVETNYELKDSFLAKDTDGHYTKLHNALFVDNEYIHINWLPQKYVDRTMQWVGNTQPDITLPIKPYVHTLSSKLMSHLAMLAFRIGNLIDEFGHSEELVKLKADLLKLFCNPGDKQEFRDVWYKALPIDDQADVDGDIKTLFSEFWFPEDQIDTVMQRLEELFRDNPKAAGNFIVELYCAKQSPFWLSPSYGHNVFRVDLYWWNRNIGDSRKYFGIFWDKLLDVPGARLHWGKYLPIPGQQYGENSFAPQRLNQNYPKFADWLKLREKMDPQQMFVTDYWRQILDIPTAKQ